MQLAVNTVGAAALGAALCCALPTTGTADPGLKFEGGPWIPALAIVSSSPYENERENEKENAADRSRDADTSLHTPILALVFEPQELGESGAELERTLGAADAGPIAIPARVSLGPASGEAEPPEEQWAPAVLVVARAEVEPPPEPPLTATGPGSEREAPPRDETGRWVPSLGFTNGLVGQGTQASVDSHFNPFGQDVRPSAAGGKTLLSPFMGGSLELMSPGLADVPGRPRLFLRGDVAVNLGFTRNIAKEGAPGAFEVPETTRGGASPPTNYAVIGGQGSTTSADPQPLLVTAGAGIAFTLDAMGRRLRIKPSIEYLREELEIEGVVNRASVPPGGNVENAQFVVLSAKQRETYQGLGPGLEIETDSARVGPLVLTLFVSGQAYRILGDRTTVLTDVRAATPGLPPAQSPDFIQGQGFPEATWTFTKSAWTYRGGVGMRFRWLPD